MNLTWNSMFKSVLGGVLAVSLALFLGACSSGSSTTAAPATPAQSLKLSGTVATGAPLKTFVTFRDGSGTTHTTITDDSGKYLNVDILAEGLTAPVLIRVQKPTGGIMYSYASKTGVANVHPLTDPIIRAWYRVKYKEADPTRLLDDDFFDASADMTLPTQTEIDFIKTVVKDVVRDILTAGGIADVDAFDPMETTFEADSTGFDAVLDDTSIGISEETGNLNVFVNLSSTLETTLEAAGASTSVTLNTANIKSADTTPPAKPATPVAAQVSNSQILVTWNASVEADLAFYRVYNNGTKLGTVTTTAFIVPNVSLGSPYSFTIEACDGAGNCSTKSDGSSSITVGTVSDSTPPDATFANLSATATGFDEIKLSWSGFTDDVGILRYRVYSCTDVSCGTKALIGKVQGTDFVHFNRTANTEYFYAVTAVDAALNESAISNVASATTGNAPAGVDHVAPAIPTLFNATSVVYNRVDLSWTAPTDLDLAGYFIYRGGNEVAMVEAKDATGAANESYSDTTVAATTSYTYWIKSFDSRGNISNIATSTVTTPEAPDLTAPSVPTGLTATADADNQITLSWTASPETDLAGYYVYRGAAKVATVTSGTSYVDTGLTPVTTYSYSVSAFDTAGNESAKSTAASATTQASPPADVSQLIIDAKTLLSAQDVPGAKAKFQLAYDTDPTSKDANFGLAITEGIMLIEDPAVVQFFANYSAIVPTIENLIYNVLDDTYEVWGTNDPAMSCGSQTLDSSMAGYAKLSSAATLTNFTGYDYYIIKTPPLSEVDVTVVGQGVNYNCSESEAWIDSWSYDTGTGDTTIGLHVGGTFTPYGSSATIYAPNGFTLSTPTGGTQQKVALSKVLGKTTASVDAEGADSVQLLDELSGLLGKLPKNKTSLNTRMKIAAKTMLDSPPSITEIQTLIADILPTISDMITKLRVVQGSGYTFTVTPAMTGGAEVVNTVLDDGEFYAIDAVLSGLKAAMNMLTAYNLDVDFSVMEYDPLSQINNPAFFTLKADGAARMSAALTALQDVVAKAESAYNHIFAEWGYMAQTLPGCYYSILAPTLNVTDNGMRLHSDYDMYDSCDPYSFEEDDHTDLQALFEAVPLVLGGQVTFTDTVSGGIATETITDGVTTITLGTWDEPFEPDYSESITFNATKVFTSPLDRTDLPTFAYSETIDLTQSQANGYPSNSSGMEIYFGVTSLFPDLTFNGVIPDPAGMGLHKTADGTYTYDSGTGVLTMNWANSDFDCNGPNVGTETNNVVVTATTMEWTGTDPMTWTRASGTAGDITGTWTGAFDGNYYELTYSGGNVSIVALVLGCGGDGGGDSPEEYSVWTGIDKSMTAAGDTENLDLHLHTHAPQGTVEYVELSGPSLATTAMLYPTCGTDVKGGVVVDMLCGSLDINTTTPQVGDIYTFVIHRTDLTTETRYQTLSQVDLTPITITSPTGHTLADANIGSQLNVTWTGPSGMSINEVHLGGMVCDASGCYNVEGVVTSATTGYINMPYVASPNYANFGVSTHIGNDVRSGVQYEFDAP